MDVIPALQQLTANGTAEQKQLLKAKLAAYLNHLVMHNFPALVQLLYRVDISEKKLKATLAQQPGKDAGWLIAEMLIERQQEKNKTRTFFRFPADDSEEEKW